VAVDQDFLRSIALFRDLAPRELEMAAQAFQERSFAKSQVIFHDDATGQYMYVVKSGRVKVSRWLPSGREVILAFHGTGEYFGEMSLIDGKTLPATVTSMAPTTILSLHRARFLELMGQQSFSLALLRELCGRFRDAWRQIEVLTHHHAEARLRMALHQMCANKGTATAEGTRIEVPLTHRELASMSGVSRETVTRVLGQLGERGLVRMDGRRIVVPDPSLLLEGEIFD
jgi:CRP/FNR family transcriptional regulator